MINKFILSLSCHSFNQYMDPPLSHATFSDEFKVNGYFFSHNLMYRIDMNL